MCDLTGEFAGRQTSVGDGAHGLADRAGRQASHAAEYLPLFGHAEAVEAGVAQAGAALDIALQGLQQMALAGVTEEEVGAAAQVFLQLPALALRHRLQWALA